MKGALVMRRIFEGIVVSILLAIVVSVFVAAAVIGKYGDYRSHKFTGNGATTSTVTSKAGMNIIEVRFHLQEDATADSLNMYIDDDATTYDVILRTVAMSGVQDVVWTPWKPVPVGPDEAFVVGFTNSDGIEYGLDIITEPY